MNENDKLKFVHNISSKNRYFCYKINVGNKTDWISGIVMMNLEY